MRYTIILLLGLAAAAVAGWQAETRADLKQRVLLRSLAAQLAPYGRLSHDRATAHFWGSGEIESLRFAPRAEWLVRQGLSGDFALHIPRLRYRDWQADEGWPETVRLQFDKATLPLAAPWPSAASGEIDWRYQPGLKTLRLTFALDAPRHAAGTGSLTLKLAEPERLAGATLLKARLDYRDLGLAQGERASLALRLGADPLNADAALATQLSQWLGARGLPPDAAFAQALARFAREPRQMTLRFDPPGALRPETLPQFAPRDRMAALGLVADTE